MNSSFIDKCLHNKFHSHKYQLSNSFVYHEESDFFSVSSTGYAQEIEIKISRSDFKADFKKKKHNSFIQILKGQKYIVRKGSEVFNVTSPIMKYAIGKDGKGIRETDKYGRVKPKRVPSGKFKEHISYGPLSSSRIKELENLGGKVEHIHTMISIFKPVLPNKFWFAVPEGLITVDDIPEYAGLYYISEDGKITTVKRAPFIHKEKHNIDKILLDKFYYLSLNLKRQLSYKQ